MKTLLLNPPSFENFDGGASSRWPATREIRSFWYPVWLAYPAGMIPGAKMVDAPPHDITVEQTIAMAPDYEFLTLFTSTPGFASDIRLAEMMKEANPKLKIAFCEGGVSWVPFMMYRLDKEYTERRREVPFLQERPSAYIRRFYYGSQPIEEPEPLRDLVTVFKLFGGEDNVMFASDWPHHDFDHPRAIKNLPMLEEMKQRILGQNAIELYNLPVPSLAGVS